MRDASYSRKSTPFSEWTITADNAEARIAKAIRICVGNYIREMYSGVPKEPIPPKISHLLLHLD
jgi:hypothetical protein